MVNYKQPVYANLDVPNGTKYIVDGQFKGILLKDVKLPETIESIGSEAFRFTRLKNITLPLSVRTVGKDAFDPLTTVDIMELDSTQRTKLFGRILNYINLDGIVYTNYTGQYFSKNYGLFKIDDLNEKYICNILDYAYLIGAFNKNIIVDEIAGSLFHPYAELASAVITKMLTCKNGAAKLGKQNVSAIKIDTTTKPINEYLLMLSNTKNKETVNINFLMNKMETNPDILIDYYKYFATHKTGIVSNAESIYKDVMDWKLANQNQLGSY